MRLKLAIALSRFAGLLSRKILGKSGETVPGRILLILYPKALVALAKNRNIILVSGTNGKTSTTGALTKIVSTLGKTVSNSTGSNLDRGAATTLMTKSEYAVLEVDELHLIRLIAQTSPKIVLLLNLTRDQLHRMHEVKRVADRWHEAVAGATETVFVGDVDDPFVNYALSASSNSIRVSFGGRKHSDAAVCPSCGIYLKWNKNNYKCRCGFTNTDADITLEPASAAARNAELANIVGKELGAKVVKINPADLERSFTKSYSGISAKIRLTKNPASWTEALSGVSGDDVILILNARQVDGIDTSWLWDVSFDKLHGKRVVVCGERALDMAYRLHVQGIESAVTTSFKEAIEKFNGTSSVEVLAAYTAFHGLVNA